MQEKSNVNFVDEFPFDDDTSTAMELFERRTKRAVSLVLNRDQLKSKDKNALVFYQRRRSMMISKLHRTRNATEKKGIKKGLQVDAYSKDNHDDESLVEDNLYYDEDFVLAFESSILYQSVPSLRTDDTFWDFLGADEGEKDGTAEKDIPDASFKPQLRINCIPSLLLQPQHPFSKAAGCTELVWKVTQG